MPAFSVRRPPPETLAVSGGRRIGPRRWLCLGVMAAAQFMFGAVPANVLHAHAGAEPGILTTTQRTANAGAGSDQEPMLAALSVLGALVLGAALSLRWMRRMDAATHAASLRPSSTSLR